MTASLWKWDGQWHPLPLVDREVEPGWDVIDDHVPVGTIYLVDLRSKTPGHMCNTETGRCWSGPIIAATRMDSTEDNPDVGYLPACLFGLGAP